MFSRDYEDSHASREYEDSHVSRDYEDSHVSRDYEDSHVYLVKLKHLHQIEKWPIFNKSV